VLSSSHDPTLRLWDVASGQTVYVLEGHTQGVDAGTFSPDGRLVLSASGDHTLRLWDVASGRELGRFAADSYLQCCAFSPDGRRAVAGSGNGALHFLTRMGGEPRPAPARAAGTDTARGSPALLVALERPSSSAAADLSLGRRPTTRRWWPFGRRG
jgi:hypothetical protein